MFWDDEIDSIEEIDAISGTRLNTYDEYKVYPANLFSHQKRLKNLPSVIYRTICANR